MINPISDEELDSHIADAVMLIPEHWLRRCLEELRYKRLEVLSVRQQYREAIKDAQRDAREAASEAYWKGTQGDEYGIF